MKRFGSDVLFGIFSNQKNLKRYIHIF